ncbi:rod shape-determining protein MreD [Bacillus altitudinis]|uniref:Rod shape-determining protein MreD n=1 Tax=Bacillus altitudinis TaxID=293387 RepID=A0ABV1S8N3_BACAB|nr:rod shape-determining protein MreD [Bacillus altitudinis]ANT57464.1 rod shape-determining protein MreD [Bacillus pumilus]MBR0627090.1 rod shape-determining protein MreD [Bacillus altitudinis S70-5-12]MBY0188112.1 rod shape-determining protein MreD [Bacillus aerophilus]NQW96445.1 rod shape-determining protein MreD [Bacillus stratosphericus]AKC66854.1 rod shape-determining protein MreD [Bacillus altitudinis]
MKRVLLAFVMLFIFVFDSIFVDLVKLPFVSDNQILAPHFILLALVFMTAFVNQKYGVIYGFIFGLLYDISYTGILGVHMFGFGALCYLLAKAFKVLQTNMLVVVFLSVIAVAVMEFYVYGVQATIQPDIMPFNTYVIERFIPTILLNTAASLILVVPLRLFFINVKQGLIDE